MVVTRRLSLSLSIVIQLWGWSVVTGTKSPTVKVAEFYDVQHERNHSAHPEDQGHSIEERELVIPQLVIEKVFGGVTQVVHKFSMSSAELINLKQTKSLLSTPMGQLFQQYEMLEEKPRVLFDLFKMHIVEDKFESLVDNPDFKLYYTLVHQQIEALPLECDKLVFHVLMQRVPSSLNEFAGIGQSPLQLVKSAFFRQRYDAVQLDKLVSVDPPHIDLSIHSEFKKLFSNKVDEEKGDAIVLLLNTMKSKNIPDELSALKAVAGEGTIYTVPILDHIKRLGWQQQDIPPEKVLELMVDSFSPDLGLDVFLQSKSLVEWFDYVKLIGKNPSELLVDSLKHYWTFPEIVKQFHVSSVRGIRRATFEHIFEEIKLTYDDETIYKLDPVSNQNNGQPRLFLISAYGAVLQSWKDQLYSAERVAELLELKKEDDPIRWIVVWYYALFVGGDKTKALDITKLLVQQFKKLRNPPQRRWFFKRKKVGGIR